MSWVEKRRPPTSIGWVENGLGSARGSAPQIGVDGPSSDEEQAERHDHHVSDGSGLDRADHDALDRDAAQERDRDRQEERGPEARPWFTSDQAMKAENIAISPCAKLIDAGRAVDEDEREREQRVQPPDEMPITICWRIVEGDSSVAQVRACGRPRCGEARLWRPEGDAAGLEHVGARRGSSARFAFCSTTSTVRPLLPFSPPTSEELLRRRSAPSRARARRAAEPRPRHQGPGDREHLLLATAELPACWARRSPRREDSTTRPMSADAARRGAGRRRGGGSL